VRVKCGWDRVRPALNFGFCRETEFYTCVHLERLKKRRDVLKERYFIYGVSVVFIISRFENMVLFL
jgi:hypothetical protein